MEDIPIQMEEEENCRCGLEKGLNNSCSYCKQYGEYKTLMR